MSPPESDLLERIAVFRHALVSRVIAPDLSRDERLAELQRILAAEHLIPGTARTRIGDSTLRDWVRAYRAGGFEALKPKKRLDAGASRLEPALVERLLAIKEGEPGLSIRRVIELAHEGDAAATVATPHSTVHRLFQRHGLNRQRDDTRSGGGVDRRRFAFRDAGQLWMSDVMHGPTVVSDGRRRRKTYLIAFLDDATRVVTHAEFALSENTRTFLPVLRQAILRRGLPERLYVDNGASYRSHQLAVVCAKLDIALIHARPYQPQGKGKIERFFRTVRAQLLPRLTGEDTTSLEAINRALGGWLEGEYHHSPHRGLEGATPLDRWAATGASVRYPAADLELEELFLFEATRKVATDRTVSLDGRLYEVDAALIGERVTLRYDPARPAAPITVVHDGGVVERARQVDLYANCFVKRHRRTGAPQSDRAAAAPPPGLAMRGLDHPDTDTVDDEERR